jgi:AcrR family transcriptional regulator
VAKRPHDHRRLPRRRGEALTGAIFEAVVDELRDHGYAGLTFEGVAARARAGKASLYRRWPTRLDLVMDATRHLFSDAGLVNDTGSFRGDVHALLCRMAGQLHGVAGEAMRGMLGDSIGASARADERRSAAEWGHGAMQEVARRAAERGEIDGGAVSPRRFKAGPALLLHCFLIEGLPISQQTVADIVDEVVLPVFGLTDQEPPLPCESCGTTSDMQ